MEGPQRDPSVQIYTAAAGSNRIRQTATLSGTGDVVEFDLATSSLLGPADPSSLAVIGTCPAGFGAQSPYDEFRSCAGPLEFTSVALDDAGYAVGDPQPIPGAFEGSLHAARDGYVWLDAESNPKIFIDGPWRRIETAIPSRLPHRDGCTSAGDLWLLRGIGGPRVFTAPAFGIPDADRNYQLFRYRLDGRTDNDWQPVPIQAISDADLVDLACGDDEAFVRAGQSLYTTAAPERPVVEAERAHRLEDGGTTRPILYLGIQETCAVVGPGGKPIEGTIRSVRSTGADDVLPCSGSVWPAESGLFRILERDGRTISERPW